MLITLTPGSHGELAHQRLGNVLYQAKNLYSSGPGDAHELQAEYVTWATEARHGLRTFISSADIDRLITTPQFMAILALQVPLTGKHIVQPSALPGPMRGLISAEIGEHIRLLEAAMADLQRWNERLKLLPGKLVVVDSSVYCHHPTRLDVWQPNQEIGAMPGDDVHLILPLPVLDELDRQKDRGQGGAATNARDTIRLLDRLLPPGAHPCPRRGTGEPGVPARRPHDRSVARS